VRQQRHASRNQETPGEDSLLSGIYAEDFILNIQGARATNWTDPRAPPLMAAATIKHYLGPLALVANNRARS
jgi:beta-glucosidase-like glycosyl hydrolase